MRRFLVLAALAVAAVAVVLTLTSSKAGGPRAPRSAAVPPPPKRHHARLRKVHGPHDRPVPILMYHVIAVAKPGVPYPELYTPPDVFTRQMHALALRGYHAVTLASVDRYWHHAIALPRKPIVISFDDGYLGDYTHALPVLSGLHWPGVLNLVVDNARTRGDLDVPQVRTMIRAGWEVDSHTVTHPDLTTLSAAQLRTELIRSRTWLRRHFGVPVNYFCYPAGRYDATVEAAVRRAGYRMATTTQPGLARPDSPYTLDRIRVDGQDGVNGLFAKLANPPTGQNARIGG
jgi:peptidoglycan/xylan/chitin deacetylase (PgdA/CDA1 family)